MHGYLVFECATEDITALKVLIIGLCAHTEGFSWHGVTVYAHNADAKALADLLDSVPWYSPQELTICYLEVGDTLQVGSMEVTVSEFSKAVAKKEIT